MKSFTQGELLFHPRAKKVFENTLWHDIQRRGQGEGNKDKD